MQGCGEGRVADDHGLAPRLQEDAQQEGTTLRRRRIERFQAELGRTGRSRGLL